jgi:GGDEF domain-containing protein
MKYIQLRDNKAHLLMVLAMLLGLGFLATTLISYYTSRASLRQSIVATELPLTSDNVYSEIQKDLVRPILISSMMARDTFLRDWVVAGEKDPLQMTRYLQEVRSHYGAMTAFFVSEGTRNYYQANGFLKQVKPQEPRDAWYFRVRDMAEPYEINVDPDMANRDRLTIFINYRVQDYARRFIGVTGVGLAVESVVRAIDDYQKRYDRQIYFVDDAGRIVLSAKYAAGAPGATQSRIQDIPGLADLAGDILAAHKGSFEYQSAGQKYFLNVRYIPELKWNLFVVKREGQGLAEIRNTLYLNWLLCLAISLTVLMLVYWVITSYQRPLEKMATTDSLTGLANRHALTVLLRQGMLDATRLRGAMSAIMLDIDHFKDLNDRLGHVAADRVLSDIGQTLRANLRSSDIACRWGGEEFLVVLTLVQNRLC